MLRKILDIFPSRNFYLQLISPLAIAPVIALIGLSLYEAAVNMAGQNWTISGITIALVILFSQYLRNIDGQCQCKL